MLPNLQRLCGFGLLLGLLAGTLRAGGPLGVPVHRFASPGDYPEGLAWDGTRLWVNNFTDGVLYAVDPADGRVIERHPDQSLLRHPEGLAWDGEHLWSCDNYTGQIVELRPTALGMEIVATYDKPAGSGSPVGLEWDGSNLWLACFGATGAKSELFALDPDSLHVVKRLQLPIWWVEDLAWDGQHLWSVDWLFRIGFAIDPATGDTSHTYRTPGPHPVGMAWDGEHLWLGDTDADSIWALDISGARPEPVRALSWSDLKRRYGTGTSGD